jgi:hypothetical protein
MFDYRKYRGRLKEEAVATARSRLQIFDCIA